MYSPLMVYNRGRMNPKDFERRMAEANCLLKFAMVIYKLQLSSGRNLLHEHPKTAKSWKNRSVRKLLKDPKVYTVDADLCMFGLLARGVDRKLVVARTTTRFMSSAPAILERLGMKCQGGHVHQHLVDGRAKAAAIYPPMLCRAMIQGAHEQMQREGGGGAPRNILNKLDVGCAIFNFG